jgi:CMP-N-acetylneuraminic acid synthetase
MSHGKNIKMFAGKPIIGYPIKELLDSNQFDSVYVSTDDPEIALIAESFGAVVPGLRPSVLANDYATTVDVVPAAGLDPSSPKAINAPFVAVATRLPERRAWL